jgi:threonine dehydratase
MRISLDQVQQAARRIQGSVVRTPCVKSDVLSTRLGCELFFKHDHLQATGSFKERGARNALMMLSDEAKSLGVIAASAGNHALALARHGKLLGIPVTVVMPDFAPLTKVVKCTQLGANVIQQGSTFDDARAHATRLANDRRLTYVHGFDNFDVIAGAGTVGLEILEDVKNLDAVLVPVGGGGLLAGIAVVLKALSPTTRLIGVETEYAPTMHASVSAGRVVKIDAKPTLADGLAIAQAGQNCFDIVKQTVDQIVLVDETHIARAVLELLEVERMLVEGAGAAAYAGLLQHDLGLTGKRVCVVLCGSNIDLSILGRLIDRGLAASGRLCRLKCAIPDRPGGLARLTSLIASTGASIQEVSHDRNFESPDIASVVVDFVLETRHATHIDLVRKALNDAGIRVL